MAKGKEIESGATKPKKGGKAPKVVENTAAPELPLAATQKPETPISKSSTPVFKTADDYMAAPSITARHALTDEDRVEVLQAVADRDPRGIVSNKAKSRLRQIADLAALEQGEPPVVAVELVPESTPEPVSVEAPVAEAEAPVAEAPVETPPEASESTEPDPKPTKTKTGKASKISKAKTGKAPKAPKAPKTKTESPRASAIFPNVPTDENWGSSVPFTAAEWECTKCKAHKPPEEFGVRLVKSSGKMYRQPQCRPCRKEASRVSGAKKRAKRAGRKPAATATEAPPKTKAPRKSKSNPTSAGSA